MADISNKLETAEAFAAIMIKEWQKEIDRLGIGQSGEGRASFVAMVEGMANGDRIKIKMSYKYYLFFVEKGYGRGTKKGQNNESEALLGSRRAKPWRNKVLTREIHRLGEIMAMKYGDDGMAMFKDLPGRLELTPP